MSTQKQRAEQQAVQLQAARQTFERELAAARGEVQRLQADLGKARANLDRLGQAARAALDGLGGAVAQLDGKTTPQEGKV